MYRVRLFGEMLAFFIVHIDGFQDVLKRKCAVRRIISVVFRLENFDR